MKLLLTSAGITNKTLKKALQELLSKPFTSSTLVFIPTAANGEVGDKSWLINDLYAFKTLGFSSIEIIDIAAVQKDVWLPRLERAEIIVFGGGNVGYLAEWLKKSGLEKELPALLQTKIYVGISAGSMVTAPQVSLSSASILYYEETGKLKVIDGLGLVDFELWPHLNSDWFPKVRLPYLESLASNVKGPFYAIDDNSAIEVVDGKVTVITEGVWKKFNEVL